jgi:predicted nucleic acid-binding protein
MPARYVVDTNLLVYALDRREPEKRERAREVLRRVGRGGTAALPAQVLSEFANACLRKLEPRPKPVVSVGLLLPAISRFRGNDGGERPR